MNIDEIKKYISDLRKDEEKFKGGINKYQTEKVKKPFFLKRIFGNLIFISLSIYDFILLKIQLLNKKFQQKHIVYTAYNFCNKINGKLEDRIVKPLFTRNIIFINTSKEIHLRKINNQKVYNIGGLVKLIRIILFRTNPQLKLFRAYQIINDSIINQLYINKEIFLLWFYDLNSLAIIFSKLRNKVRLIEVQHGSIINYPPYIKPAPNKILDVFYVKNQATIEYLKDHLCKNFECEYKLIPYPKGKTRKYPGTHILYASTVDFKGLHPVFFKFLKTVSTDDLKLKVRLHPRERTFEIEELFKKQLSSCGINFSFDYSKNWLEENEVENLIVVSPWSSSIEDAYDNGYKTIIIDPAGKQRFEHLIDNKNCYYTDDLLATINELKRLEE